MMLSSPFFFLLHSPLATANQLNLHEPKRNQIHSFQENHQAVAVPPPSHQVSPFFMLPISDASFSDRHPLFKPRASPATKSISPSSSLPSFSSLFVHPRSCLILSILVLQTLIVLISQFSPFPSFSFFFTRPKHQSLPAPAAAAADSQFWIPNSTIAPTENPNFCELGKFFVYDLPPAFNTDIYENCDKLSPWGSLCDKLSNGGYGRPASSVVASIVPPSLADAWFWTDQFTSEIIFHNRLLRHECRTTNPGSATAFYIPFYAGLAVGKHLWSSNSTAKDRDRPCDLMLDWVQSQPWFRQSLGWNHFTTMGRITWDFRRSKADDWGSHCIYAPAMRNITRLLIERNPWDYFDVGIPYPTGFHPSNSAQIAEWQAFVRSRARSTLFCFAGATRGFIKNDFRSLLLDQCRAEPGLCRVVDCSGSTRCSNGTSEILETFLDSTFCLQPRGDSFTRRSIFDCMIAGSIPVFFWRRTAYFQYEWFLPGEPASYSVFIHRDAVKNGTTSIKKVFESYSKEEVNRMREKVIEYLPRLVYSKPEGEPGSGSVKDAVDVAVEGVLTRIRQQKENGFWW